VDILIIHGHGMNLSKLFLGMIFLAISLKGEEMKKIETIWDNIESYWKVHDSKLLLNQGDKESDIEKFELKVNIVFPKEVRYSLMKNYQYSRIGTKGSIYPWFGTNAGINLLSIKEIETFYTENLNSNALEDTKLPNVATVFHGSISPYVNVKTWDKYWIPIVCNDDIPIVIFLDLNQNSNNYLKLVALYVCYLDGVGDHFRFAFIENNYLDFLEELQNMFLEYKGDDFEYYYYEKKLGLPKGFFER